MQIGMRIALALLIFLPAMPGRFAAAAEDKPVKVLPGEVELAASLKEREAAVAAKEESLARKEENLRTLEKEITAKLAQLAELQLKVEARLTDLQKTEDDRFQNLIKIYSSMKPAKLAPLLDQMEDAEVARILKAMKTEAVAQIMAKIEPEKAVRISKELGML